MVYQLTAEPDDGRRFTYVSRGVERLNEVTAEEERRHFTATLESRVEEYTREIRAVNDALRKALSRSRDLAEDVIRAEERERKRLATVLHDDLQQL